MLRSELVENVTADQRTLSPQQVRACVDVFFEVIASQLVSGGRVELRGFGTFTTKRDGARAGRNPLTGEPVLVGQRRKPVFRCSKALAGRIDADHR